jgi:hypothetical protein
MRLVAHNSFAAHSADFGTMEDQQDDGASTPRESHDHQEGSPNHMQLNSIQEFMAMYAIAYFALLDSLDHLCFELQGATPADQVD